eukprot:superscaffoldBa00009371_g24048
MDPANSTTLEAALHSQGVHLTQHEEQLSSVCHGLWELNSCYEGLHTSLSNQIFDHLAPGPDAARACMDLCQGKRQVADYAIEFRTLSADYGWNVPSLFDTFHHGLAGAIKDQLVSLERPSDLDSFIALAVKIDNRLREREMKRAPKVPQCYHDLKEVFNKSRATSLPPHREYENAIDLLPGTSLPKGRLYSLSAPDREAIDKYISASLAAGITRPSSSPAWAGFFFVDKKDKSLRPCIGYRGLNEVNIKN